MDNKWLELVERLGTYTEHIFIPNLHHLAKQLGCTIQKSMCHVEYKQDGMYAYYEVIVVMEDKKGRELVFVVQINKEVKAEYFEEFKKNIENLLKYEPDYKGKVVPVLAGLIVSEDLLDLAQKHKILLVRMGVDYLEALNPEILESF